jgi:hypothetical protein
MNYDSFATSYFENLDLPASVQKNLMDRLHLDLGALSEKVKASLDITDDAWRVCKGQGGKADKSAKEWKRCSFTCNTLITDAVNQETGSTAFMLKLLADSVIRPDGEKYHLKFRLDPSFFEQDKAGSGKGADGSSGCRLLTGKWKDDAPFLHLVLPPSRSSGSPPKGVLSEGPLPSGRLSEGPLPSGRLSEGPLPSGRLIMGFGPSAAGKTHWTKTILRLLSQADDHFPKVFFTVDGGLVRESSAVYQFATEMAHCAGYAGFSNLHDGMFVTSRVKDAMEHYLLEESKYVPISLYVPETLGKCEMVKWGVPIPGFSCENYMKKFHSIARDDKWIGLLIWQHATAEAHDADTVFTREYPGMECEGCKASGEKRAKDEGKPYDGKTHAQSMKNGRKYMELAPGGRYEIHNAGRPGGVSVLWDRSVLGVGNRFSEIIRKAPGIQYVDARVTSQAGKETGRVLGEFTKEFLKDREGQTAVRNAKAASSILKNIQASSNLTVKASNMIDNPKSNEDKKEAARLKKAIWNETIQHNPAAFPMRQEARRAAASDTGSVLRNAANSVYASRNKTRNAYLNARHIRESSASLNAIKQAEKAAAKRLAALHNAKRLISEFQDTRGETHVERAARIAKAARAAEGVIHNRRGNNELSVNDFLVDNPPSP